MPSRPSADAIRSALRVPRAGRRWLVAGVLAAAVSFGAAASALDVVGYSPAANDRFVSGYPTAPVTNTGTAFIGRSYSWLGVGWATGDATKSFGFVSPRHYLVARHYGGWPTIRVLSAGGQLVTGTQSSVTDTGYGFVNGGSTPADLSIGTLTASLSSAHGLPRYGVLDANVSSTTNSSYNGQPLLVYGRGPDGTQSPRIGSTSINGTVVASGSNIYISSTVSVSSGVVLQSGDSGSPDFIPWTNPDGSPELTIIGNNAATDFSTINVFNFLGNSNVMAAVNRLTTPDGYALRLVGTPTNSWVGSSSTSIGNRAAWGLSPPSSAPSDKYVLFSGSSAGNGRVVSVDSNANLRGAYFKSTGSGTLGFTFSGTGTLTLGRGGLTNYDASRQTFTAAIALGDDQYWNVGAGGVTVAAVSTGTAGSVLEIDGSGTARFTGTISGSGGLALTGRRAELTGSNTYSGGTWVHEGVLTAAAGSLAATSAIRVEAGTLSAVNYNPAATLAVAAAGTATISGTGLVLGSVTNANPTVAAVEFTATSGTISLAALTGPGATRFGSHAAITAGVVSGSVAVAGRLTAAITGGTVAAGGLASGTISGGTTTVNGPASIGTLAAGSVTLAAAGSSITSLTGGRLTVSGNHDVSVGSLVPSGSGLVDVGVGSMTVLAGLSESDVRSLLVAGMNGGDWNGTSGVTSAAVATAVAAGQARAVGWLDVGGGSMLFTYAAPGDTNVDGIVDLLDAGNFLAFGGYDEPLSATWLDGDFNYDGFVDILDAAGFVSAGLYDAGPYELPAGLGAVAAVPEPSSWGGLAIAVMALALVRARFVPARARFVPTGR
jgi:autotransporter-associated beta strand protein